MFRVCRLKHKDVFTLIQKHNLYGVIQDMLIDLMDLDHKKTIELLLEKNTISSDKIVEKLKQNELHLYRVSEYEICILSRLIVSFVVFGRIRQEEPQREVPQGVGETVRHLCQIETVAVLEEIRLLSHTGSLGHLPKGEVLPGDGVPVR